MGLARAVAVTLIGFVAFALGQSHPHPPDGARSPKKGDPKKSVAFKATDQVGTCAVHRFFGVQIPVAVIVANTIKDLHPLC